MYILVSDLPEEIRNKIRNKNNVESADICWYNLENEDGEECFQIEIAVVETGEELLSIIGWGHLENIEEVMVELNYD